MPQNINNVYDIMNASHNMINYVKSKNKKMIIIAMSKLGLLSRVYTEWTNSLFTFEDNDVKTFNRLGQCSIDFYKKLRKRI